MKNIILIIVMAMSCLTKAQEFNIKWGESEKIAGKSSSPNLLGVVDNQIYVLKSDNAKDLGHYYISVYDKEKLNKIKSFVFEKIFDKNLQDNDLEEVILFNDKIIILSSSKTELIGTILDLNGNVVKAKTVLAKVNEKEKGFSGYEVAFSPDKTKLLVVRKIDDRDNEKATYHLTIYDSEFQKKNTLKQIMPYDGKHFGFGNVVLVNSGDVYFSGRLLIDGLKAKYDTYKSIFFNLNMSAPKPELTDITIPVEKKVISTFIFQVTDNKIEMTGLYAKDKDAEHLEGIFTVELETKGFSLIKSNYIPFAKGLSTRSMRTAKIEAGLGFTYRIREIYNDEKSNKFVVLENTSVGFHEFNGAIYKYTVASDIVVIKLTEANTVAWNVTLPKYQFLDVNYSMAVFGLIPVNTYRFFKRYEDLLFYSCLHKGNTLNFIFNEHLKNQGLKTANTPFNSFKKSYCAVISLDMETGKWVKKSLFTKKDAEMLMTPNNSKQISDDEIISFSFTDDKGSAIGTIQLD